MTFDRRMMHDAYIRGDCSWPLSAVQIFRSKIKQPIQDKNPVMNTKYYRYQLVPGLEERGEVDAAMAISALCDLVDELQIKVQTQAERIRVLRDRKKLRSDISSGL